MGWRGQCPGRFLGIIGGDRVFHKSKPLHVVDIVWFYIEFGYILQIPLK
jgi:hypothetical protein